MRRIIKLIRWWLPRSINVKDSHTHTYASIDALPKSSRASASLHFFFHLCFHYEGFTRAERIARPDTTYTINTSERHKSGLGMCHGNHFLFLLRAAPGVRRTLPLPPFDYVCTHERLSVGYHDTPRAPHRTVFLILEKETSAERESRQMFTLPREELYSFISDPLEIGGGPQWYLYHVILPDYLCHLLFSTCAVARSAKKRV